LTDVDCSKSPSIVFDLIANSGEVEYHIADVAKILLANSTNSPVPTCQQWNGRRVRVWPTPPSDPKLPAEIAKLIFQ
jgi:hypothetical protein